MGTTADKLNKLLNTKQAIKKAIVDKGVDVGDDTKFADYPSKIASIPMEGVDPYFEYLWNAITNNNTDYQYLFYNYNGSELDVSNFDTSQVTSMYYMFYGCNNLTQLDVSNWDTSQVTTMYGTFNGCKYITELDVSNWDTGRVESMYGMFDGCKYITELDLSNWDTGRVTSMYGMFNNCSSLTELDVSNFDTSQLTNMSGMFNNCSSLTSLDVSNWDINKVTGSYQLSTAFNGCTNLVDLKAPKNINAPMDVTRSTALSHDSLMSIINNLMTQTSTKTLTLGTTNLAKLTADEVAIATNKGWTVK